MVSDSISSSSKSSKSSKSSVVSNVSKDSKASRDSKASKASKASKGSKGSKNSKALKNNGADKREDEEEPADHGDEEDHKSEDLLDSDSEDKKPERFKKTEETGGGAGRDKKLRDVELAPADGGAAPFKPIENKLLRRDKAFMGHLVGHLGKAKLRLESDKGTEARRLQQSAEQRIHEKLRTDRHNLAEVRRQEEAKRRWLETESYELTKRLENHYWRMTNFIRTSAEPTIFFLPRKHTDVTLGLLADTKKAIERKLASLKKKDFISPPIGHAHESSATRRNTGEADRVRDSKRQRPNDDISPRREKSYRV